MRGLLVAVAVLLLAACEEGMTSAETSPVPSVPPFQGVMVHTAGPGEPYFVQLISSDGHAGPWAQGLTRSAKTLFAKEPCMGGPTCDSAETAPYSMPETSASTARVYFLDGDTKVMALDTDGKVRTVRDLDSPPNSQVMFSVSPDDSRVAISIVTLATSFEAAAPFDDRMYVEDLRDGANRVELYRSGQVAEWPIGWRGQDLVVAVGTSDITFDDNLYGALQYELVYPANGQVRAHLFCNQGLVVAAGTACATGFCMDSSYCEPGSLGIQSWDGTRTEISVPAGAERIKAYYTHLSPAGDKLAVAMFKPDGSFETAVFVAGGLVRFTSVIGAPQGWLDETHLVVSTVDMVAVLDLASGEEVPVVDLQSIPQQGQPHLIATLPSSL